MALKIIFAQVVDNNSSFQNNTNPTELQYKPVIQTNGKKKHKLKLSFEEKQEKKFRSQLSKTNHFQFS